MQNIIILKLKRNDFLLFRPVPLNLGITDIVSANRVYTLYI